MVDSKGGIYGRKLELVSARDDQISNNQEQVQALLDQDNVFAVAPIATIFSFSGAKTLVDQNVPTFGWNINDEYTGHPNMFGSNSGALCNGCVGTYAPYLAKQLHKKKIGVLAYNVANSAQCVDGYSKSFDKYPTAKIVFLTKSLSFGATDFSVEVGQMKSKGVDMVMTCMDTTAVLNLAKEMRKQDLKAIQYLPNGYDAKLVAATTWASRSCRSSSSRSRPEWSSSTSGWTRTSSQRTRPRCRAGSRPSSSSPGSRRPARASPGRRSSTR
jgi:hypothetical protein